MPESNSSKISSKAKRKGIKVGFGFEINKKALGLHIDAMVLMLNEEGKLISDKHFIFFNNPLSPDASIEHLGSITMDTKDDEQILIDFSKVTNLVKRILFFVNIHDADKKKQNFDLVENLYIRFTNLDTKQEIAQFSPEKDDNYKKSTLIVLSEFIFISNEWQIEALGDCYKAELGDLIDVLHNEYTYDRFKQEYIKSNGNYSIKSILEKDIENQYYKSLECTKDSTDDEIKKKYKELVKSFHPDVIQSKKLHKDIVEFANKRFKEIKDAYEYLKERRKFN